MRPCIGRTRFAVGAFVHVARATTFHEFRGAPRRQGRVYGNSGLADRKPRIAIPGSGTRSLERPEWNSPLQGEGGVRVEGEIGGSAPDHSCVCPTTRST